MRPNVRSALHPDFAEQKLPDTGNSRLEDEYRREGCCLQTERQGWIGIRGAQSGALAAPARQSQRRPPKKKKQAAATSARSKTKSKAPIRRWRGWVAGPVLETL